MHFPFSCCVDQGGVVGLDHLLNLLRGRVFSFEQPVKILDSFNRVFSVLVCSIELLFDFIGREWL